MRFAKHIVIGLGLACSMAWANNASAMSQNVLLPTVLNLQQFENFSPGVTLLKGTTGDPFELDFYFKLTYNAMSSFALVGTYTNLTSLVVDIFDVTTSSGSLDTDGFADAGFTTGALTAGDTYKIKVAGNYAASQTFGSFSGDFVALPVPAAAWLLLSGVAGLGAMARRRKAEAA